MTGPEAYRHAEGAVHRPGQLRKLSGPAHEHVQRRAPVLHDLTPVPPSADNQPLKT